MFENKDFEGIYYTRFIASWYNVGGKKIRFNDEFRSWLKTLTINGKSIPEDIIDEIIYLATNGKLELEVNARNFKNKFSEIES